MIKTQSLPLKGAGCIVGTTGLQHWVCKCFGGQVREGFLEEACLGGLLPHIFWWELLYAFPSRLTDSQSGLFMRPHGPGLRAV